VWCEVRRRVLSGNAVESLREKLLARCRACGWLKARGQQRPEASHVLVVIRVLNRLASVAETLRAALAPRCSAPRVPTPVGKPASQGPTRSIRAQEMGSSGAKVTVGRVPGALRHGRSSYSW
jgi:hypothetical protein